MWPRRYSRRRSVTRHRKSHRTPSAARLGLEPLEGRLMLSATAGRTPEEGAALLQRPAALGMLLRPIDARVGDILRGEQDHDHDRDFDFELVFDNEIHFGDDSAAGDGVGGSGGAIGAGALHPLTSIPALHSLPGAPATLFLDFDGHFEPVWVAHTNVTNPAYDVDGDPTTFSDLELQNIADIWTMVAEDFAPFNINVTTVQPSVLAPGVPINQANGKALRIAFGGTSQAVLGMGTAGYAYIGAFTNSAANVAYVFSTSNPIATAVIATHEAGHSFGLQHASVYNAQGVGSGLVSNDFWHPIMQSSIVSGTAVSTWSQGATVVGATSHQDDMAMIANSTNGFGYRPDDHGATAATATPLSFDGVNFSGAGVIERNNDVDAWSFSLAETRSVRLTLDPAALHANLDAVLELRNSAGVVIAADRPRDSQGAEIVADLPAGVYTLFVTKEAAYGYVGQYTLSGVSVAPAPRVVAVDPADMQGLASLGNVRVTFADAIDPATFDASDVTLSGPFGPIAVTGVAAVAGSGNRQFDVAFPGQTAFAQYAITVGPNIRNPAGRLMNQDVDNQFGEASDDRFQTIIQYASKGTPWAVALGGDFSNFGSSDRLMDLVTDAAGNVYVTGEFRGTAQFGGIQLTAAGNERDAYVAKLDADGDVVWARRMGGSSGADLGHSIAVDAAGNSYVLGTFQGPADFGATQLTSSGGADVFLAKLDAGGNFLWARRMGGSGADASYGLAVDGAGNVVAVGAFSGTATFGSQSLTSGGGNDLFVAKLNAAGAFLWTAQAAGAGSFSVDAGLAIDAAGDLYVSGAFTGAASFGATQLHAFGVGADGFVAKLSGAGGAFVWAKPISGEAATAAWGLAVDNAGGLYATGQYRDSATFGSPGDAGYATLTAAGDTDAFIARLSAAAGEVQWAYGYGGQTADLAREVFVDAAGDVYFAGRSSTVASYRGTSLAAKGSIPVWNSGAPAEGDAFVVKVDSAGGFLAGWMLGDAAAGEEARNISVDAAGNLYVGGWINRSSELLPGTVLGHGLGVDGFVMKLTMGAGIRVSPTSGLVTSENGGSSQFSVVLQTQPTANVTIPVSSSDLTEGTVSTSSLTFTPANWNVPQMVTVTGADDSAVDGDVAYAVVLGPAASADASYHGLNPADVSLTNADNDVPPTSFYVVDDASANRTFAYGPNGEAVESYALNSGNSTPKGVATTAAGDRMWVVDANRKVFVYDTAGALLGSWTAGTMASNATPEGIAVNGTDVWIVDSRSDKVFRYAGAAGRLSGSQNAASSFNLNSGNKDPKDIVADGASLWVVNDSSTDKVFKYNLSGSLQGSWTIGSANSAPTGLTIDPASPGDVWIVDSGTDRVYLYAGAAARTSGSQAPAASFALASGNGNPQGLVYASQPNLLPAALAGGPYAGSEGAPVQLDGSGSWDADGTIVSYAWDLDNDGQYDDAVGPAPIFLTTADGTYAVGLKVTDDRGAAATSTATVTIANVAPTAVAGGPYYGNEGGNIQLSAAGSSDPGQDIVSYAWDLDGDGQYDDATGVTAVFNSDVDGMFIVGLRVTDHRGATSVATAQVTVANVAPTASAGGPYASQPGVAVAFAGSAADPGADVLTYQWDFDYNGVTFAPDASGANLVSPSHVYAAAGSYTVALRVSDGDGGVSALATASVLVTAVPPAPQDVLYFSLLNNATVGGVAAANEDILALDASGAIRKVFDGSDVGLSGLTLGSFDVISANQILMSFTAAASIAGVGTVDDSDVVLFTASSLGENTAGTFSMYFDGSDVGLTTSGEALDAVHRLADGRLVISTTGSASVPGVSADAADLLLFTPTSLGANTAGAWSMYFDASDVGLTTSAENVDAVAIDAAGKIYLSTTGNFSVSGVSGANEDVFVFTPAQLGGNTAGSYSSSLFFDGSPFGLAGNAVTGIDLPDGPAPAAAIEGIVDEPAVDRAFPRAAGRLLRSLLPSLAADSANAGVARNVHEQAFDAVFADLGGLS